jgi:glyoxylase-like metal-dependent hydrolase (beta-lactamase superfamily II)
MEAIPSTKLPHTFQTYQTPHHAQIYRIPINAFPDFWAYAYLVLAGEYRVLIDTGSGFGDANEDLAAGFEAASEAHGEKIRFEDLTHVLITHGHIDHFGGLPFVRERAPQAKVGIHELDLRTLTNYEERVLFTEHRLLEFLAEAGVSEETQTRVMGMYRINKSLFRSVSVDFTYEAMGMRLGPFSFLHVPGHSPGQVAIRLENVLFAGDHVLTHISPHQWPERITLHTGLDHYLHSLEKILAWSEGISIVLSGHNDSIFDLPARIQEIREVHTERLEQTLTFLSEPHTVADVSREIFGEVSGYNVLLAIEEAGAHVEYLYQRGLLRIVNLDALASQRIPLRYQRINDPVAAQVHPCC